jgi:hypothetical protein
MDSASGLRAEDRPEFERILDGVLRSEEIERALRGLPAVLNSEQLRTRVLRAADTVAAAAAAECHERREGEAETCWAGVARPPVGGIADCGGVQRHAPLPATGEK